MPPEPYAWARRYRAVPPKSILTPLPDAHLSGRSQPNLESALDLNSPRSPSAVRVLSTPRRHPTFAEDLVDGGEKLTPSEGLRENEVISLSEIAKQRAAHRHRPHIRTDSPDREDEGMPVSPWHDHVSEEKVKTVLKLCGERYGFPRAPDGVNPVSVALQH